MKQQAPWLAWLFSHTERPSKPLQFKGQFTHPDSTNVNVEKHFLFPSALPSLRRVPHILISAKQHNFVTAVLKPRMVPTQGCGSNSRECLPSKQEALHENWAGRMPNVSKPRTWEMKQDYIEKPSWQNKTAFKKQNIKRIIVCDDADRKFQ